MGKKSIKLTESKLHRLIEESLSKVLCEGYGYKQGTLPNIDATEWSIVADRYKQYAQEIDLFIKEFETFFSVLQKATQKLGLVLVDADNDGMDEDNPVQGQKIQYCFTDGTDYRILYNNEEAYDRFCQKMEELGSELEYEINPTHYQAMQVKVSYDEEITVDVDFGLWY